MEDNKKKKETFEQLHKKPVSRRDFLASGLIPFAAYATLPSWITMFSNAGYAQAAELCSAGSGLSNFVSLKLSGGAAMSSNFVPFDQGRQALASYSKIGLGSGSSLGLTTAFANRAPFYSNSQMLAGIMSVISQETYLNTVFVGIPVRSQDDSSNNKFDLTGLVSNAGLIGNILPNLGASNTGTGVNNLPAYITPPAPLVVRNFDDIPNSLGVTGSLAQLSTQQQGAVFRTIQSLSASQSARLANMNGGNLLKELLSGGQELNHNLVANKAALNIDPLAENAYSTIWGINNNTNKSSMDFVFATMVYNALNGNAGTVNLEIGGYDYHNGTRASGDQKDLEAGVVIGKVLESFASMKKKGFIVVTSDGSVSSPESDTAGGPWVSDRGTSGCAYMIAYDPITAPVTKSFQLGHFNSGQAADEAFLTGGSPETAAGAMLVNYLSFNKKTSMVESLLPRIFDTAQIELMSVIG